jgi:hypothetical protein
LGTYWNFWDIVCAASPPAAENRRIPEQIRENKSAGAGFSPFCALRAGPGA